MALLPLKDDNPLTQIRFQYVTVGLILVNVAVFLWQHSLGERSGADIYGFGTIPAVLFGSRDLTPELVAIPAAATLITSIFLHGGWMHLFGNMLFLWIFGDNIEDAMGHVRFLGFYLACGIAGALTHAVINADSVVPMVGASGAISGVLGAYLVLHPKAKILVLVFYFPIRLPAFIVLGVWIGMQVLNAWGATGANAGGVAWWAHIGGFAAGVALIFPMRRQGVALFDRGGPLTLQVVTRRLGGARRGRVPDSGDRHR